MTLKKVVFHVSTTILVAVIMTAITSAVRQHEAESNYHFQDFPPTSLAHSNHRAPALLVTGRTVSNPATLTNVLSIVAANGWLIALRGQNHVTSINPQTGLAREFSDLPSVDKPYTPYNIIWNTGRGGDVLVGSNFRLFVRLSVATDGTLTLTGDNPFHRDIDILSSFPLANGQWASNGLFKDDTTLLINRLSGNRLTVVRAIKQPVFPLLAHPFVSMEVNRTSIAVEPNGHRIVQGFWFAPRIYTYDEAGSQLNVIAEPAGIKQSFSEQQVHGASRMKYLPQTTRCYIALAATEKYIFALYSGQTIKESPSVNGNQIHVFTWDGQLAQTIYLETHVSSLLWALHREAPPAIIEYQVPMSLRSDADLGS